MLSIILNWLYATITIFPLGFVVVSLFEKKFGCKLKNVDEILVTGIIIATLYAQVFSLFYKVGLAANIVLCLIAIACFWCYRREMVALLQEKCKSISPAKLLVFVGSMIVVCYFTSRGYEHYDTGLYHAQAIRWIEEYGVVPGLANINYRLAYNSSAFAITALYSFSFVLGQSLHTMSGYFILLLCLGIVFGYRKREDYHIRVSDFIRVAAIYYVTTTFASLNSPSSDYFALGIAVYIVLKYLDRIEQSDDQVAVYGWLSLLACFAITLKISAAPMILITIKPAVMLLKEKDWRKILSFLGMGIAIVLPFVIRGVVISGWLLYPSTFIDLFSFDFKVLKDIADADRTTVTLWGRGSYYGETFLEWGPRWFVGLDSMVEKVLITLDVFAMLAMLVLFVYELCKKKLTLNQAVLDVTIIASFVFWFVSAPLIRYGYAYVLLLIFLVAARCLAYIPMPTLHRVAFVTCILLFCYKAASTWDLAKGFVLQDYYIWQQDYIQYPSNEIEVNGVAFYEANLTDQIGYDAFPGISLQYSMEFRGDSIEDGFRYK